MVNFQLIFLDMYLLIVFVNLNVGQILIFKNPVGSLRVSDSFFNVSYIISSLISSKLFLIFTFLYLIIISFKNPMDSRDEVVFIFLLQDKFFIF
jgi:hypothetical protein